MAFEVPELTYTLTFEGSADYDGLVVKVRPPTVGEALELLDLAWLADDALPATEQVRKTAELYDAFLSRLVEWNLTRAGQAVPTTMDGFKTLPNGFLNRIVRSWLFDTSAVAAPLDVDSNTGVDSVDESLIPMTAA